MLCHDFTYLDSHLVEEVESRSHHSLPERVVEGCYSHKVLFVAVADHNQVHSFHIAVEANAMEEDIRLDYSLHLDYSLRLGCSLQRDIQVEVSVFVEGNRHNRRLGAVGHRSHPGLDNKTLP